MQTKHTPGPWAYRDANNNTDAIIVFNPRKGHELAILRNGNEANARLIAAAPELLSVALALDDIAERIDHDPDSALGELVARARAAIAKATGAEA